MLHSKDVPLGLQRQRLTRSHVGKRQCDFCMQSAMGWSCSCEACISGFWAIGLNCAQMGDLPCTCGGHSDGQIKGSCN